MKSEQATLGRTFILKFDHNDDFLEELKAFIKQNQIKAGTIQLLGALKKAGIVTGPQKDELPPTPIERQIQDAHETVGFGTIFWQDDEPKIHIHASLGRDKDTTIACIRKETQVFIVIEAILQEYKDTTAKRQPDNETGMSLLSFDDLPEPY
ncbi:MAG: DUF296 domain-containing protein [Candidatus Aenigmarchaeota archaeon]|nr:DUF296 domain-containing protein [Candidatus Aenigmarchaeota archaeon]